jgi:hypothetical protein
LGVTISIVLLGLILAFLLPLPAWRFVFPFLGADVELYFSALAQLAMLLGALAGVGTDAVMRDHPRVAGRSLAYTLTFWPLPASVVALSLVLLSNLRWWSSRLVLVGLTGAALALIVVLERRSIKLAGDAWAPSRFILDVATYIVALLAFSALYGARTQEGLVAMGTFCVGTALALRPLRQAEELSRLWLYAMLTGLAMGQLALALTYYPLAPSTGGALLLLVFYSVTTAARRELSEQLQRRDMVEVVAVFCVGLVLLVGRTQGFW